jgi:hypothetical protein
MRRGSSKTENRWLLFIMVVALSVAGLLSTGCASSVAMTSLSSRPPETPSTSEVVIKNTTMFDLDYVIVKEDRDAPFYMEKNLVYFGWLKGDSMLTIKNVPTGDYHFVFKIGYHDDILIHDFIVLKGKPQIITISDISKRFRVGG